MIGGVPAAPTDPPERRCESRTEVPMNPFEPRPQILEVTLRDGSYMIDFQFTAQDTALIAGALEAAGFRWIEVGHGLGLNASASGKGAAAATDEEYLEVTAQALTVARWGMFFIPGIGRSEDLRLAARYGMSFIRVGTNINEIHQAESFIKEARDLGMLVSYNGMKSYALSPELWGRHAAQAQAWGADIVCLVDSAGSMYPEEVSSYLRAARKECGVPLGFHGHDNLSLSMANTLRAIEEGAVLVDSSLQGMGRSAGNAVSEVLVAILTQRGLLTGIDMKKVMNIGAGLIRPLLGRREISPMAVTSGFARFHSSLTPKVVQYAQKHGIDVRDLIVRLCQEDLISAPDDLLERLGRELASEKMPCAISIPVGRLNGLRHCAGKEAVESLIRELRPHALKFGKYSAINAVIGGSPQPEIGVSGNIQHTAAHVTGSVSYTTDAQLDTILQVVDGNADVLLLDVDCKPFGPTSPAATAARTLRKTVLLTYLDSRVWVSAVEDQAVRLLSENLEGIGVVIAGVHPRTRLLALRLSERRARVALLSHSSMATCAELRSLSLFPEIARVDCWEMQATEARNALAEARLVVVWPEGEPWFGQTEARAVSADACVLQADNRALHPEASVELHRRNILMVKANLWPTLAGTLLACHESQRVCRGDMGRGVIAGVSCIAGGALGARDDVIVDSIRTPSRVIGIADGEGGIVFRYSADQTALVQRVAGEIQSRILASDMSAVR